MLHIHSFSSPKYSYCGDIVFHQAGKECKWEKWELKMSVLGVWMGLNINRCRYAPRRMGEKDKKI